MFTVYKITNQINNKCYIGSSTRVEKRWKEHRNAAFNPNSHHYNYPLYAAFRKYGIENFTFEVIKDDFSSLEEMSQYEHDMIIYYNSYKNGYNQTLMTDRTNLAKENTSKYIQQISQRCAKIDIYNNILEIYSSYHEAARKNGFDGDYRATTIRKVCKGEINHFHDMIFRDLDQDGSIIEKPIKHNYGKKPLVRIDLSGEEDDYYYDSISEAAKDLTNGCRRQIQLHLQGSLRYSTIQGYLLRELDIYGNIIENNIKIEDKIKEYNRTNPCINGERHTIKDWCQIYNISSTSYYNRIKHGYDPIQALITPKRR